MEQDLINFIGQFAASHPWLASIIAAIGVLRLIMKPFMSFIQAVVSATPTKVDDRIVQDIETSKFWKSLTYMLDWFTSVKVGPQAPAAPTPAVKK